MQGERRWDRCGRRRIGSGGACALALALAASGHPAQGEPPAEPSAQAYRDEGDHADRYRDRRGERSERDREHRGERDREHRSERDRERRGDRAERERAEPGWGRGLDRVERALRRERARAERREARLRRHPAYDLGRREAVAEAAEMAAPCADDRAVGQLAMAGDDMPIAGAWRVSPLYVAPRARRLFVSGYLECLRAHRLDPRFRGGLPVTPPEAPPLEESLPAPTTEESAFLEAHSRHLWDDGNWRCEQDLRSVRGPD